MGSAIPSATYDAFCARHTVLVLASLSAPQLCVCQTQRSILMAVPNCKIIKRSLQNPPHSSEFTDELVVKIFFNSQKVVVQLRRSMRMTVILLRSCHTYTSPPALIKGLSSNCLPSSNTSTNSLPALL